MSHTHKIVKKLSDLVTDKKIKSGDTSIHGLTSDSRTVKKGFLFAAIPGVKDNGQKYISEAIQKGAVAILHQGKEKIDGAIDIQTDNVRLDLSKIANRFYDQQPENIVAVTGTSGKSSVVHFCRQIWNHLKLEAACFGTIGITRGQDTRELDLTTPDTVMIHEILHDLKNDGVTHLAMEASSHGIEQHRLDSVQLKAAAFTNLSQDHLDYHQTMAKYLEAKLHLFTRILPQGAIAVLNADSPEFEKIRKAATIRNQKIISFGKNGQDIQLVANADKPTGQETRLKIFGKDYHLHFPLLGEIQLMNALTALALVLASDEKINQDKAVEALSYLTTVSGRLELIATHPNGAKIFNDYAHKPEALQKILTILRPLTQNHLHVLFGCGGERDKAKRPIMGAIAAALADVVTITDDNPRHEDPEAIRRDILVTCPKAKEIGDRQQAIEHAISQLQPGDILVVAGKGHELGQKIGDKVIPFSDTAVVQEIINKLSTKGKSQNAL